MQNSKSPTHLDINLMHYELILNQQNSFNNEDVFT